jgi:hypothetical protein
MEGCHDPKEWHASFIIKNVRWKVFSPPFTKLKNSYDELDYTIHIFVELENNNIVK